MIIGVDELPSLRGAVSMVDGGFDPIHAGHIAYLREAAALGAPVFCNLAPDSWVERKHPLFLPQEARAQILDAICWVDYVHPSCRSTAEVLQLLRPRAYVKGDDWRGRLPEEEVEICSRLGIDVVYLDTVTTSSSALLERHRAPVAPSRASERRESQPRPLTVGLPIDAVVGHHLDGYRSGVARFNELLAERLGVPVRGLFDPGGFEGCCPLLSFKLSELDTGEAQRLEKLVDGGFAGELFLHELSGHPLEERLARRARRVHCGNLEILDQVGSFTDTAQLVWTPGLILDDRPYRPTEITVFSFGMAHKIQTGHFRRLRELLDASGRSYAVYVSAANHETASIRDAEIVFREMHEIFPDELYFLGNLSDVAVTHELRRATFFAAFFEGGVRANNTSVATALERGCAVITNLDRYSPSEYVHMETVIDIERCAELPESALDLARLRVGALETARARGWQPLLAVLSGMPGGERS